MKKKKKLTKVQTCTKKFPQFSEDSETFVKEKPVCSSKILDSNLMHKTYSTYGH